MPEVPPQISGKVSFNVTLRHTYVVLGELCELVVLQQYSFSVHTTNPPDPSSQTFWDARPGEHLFAPFTHPFAILPEFSMQQYGSSMVSPVLHTKKLWQVVLFLGSELFMSVTRKGVFCTCKFWLAGSAKLLCT